MGTDRVSTTFLDRKVIQEQQNMLIQNMSY